MARSKTQEAYEKTVARYGCPIEKLAEFATTSADENVRLSALKEWASYGNAKVKALEVSGPDGEEVRIKSGLIDSIMDGLANLRK